jgi:hypothetical protein
LATGQQLKAGQQRDNIPDLTRSGAEGLTLPAVELGAPTLRQVHILEADDLVVAPVELGRPAAAEIVPLPARGCRSSSSSSP